MLTEKIIPKNAVWYDDTMGITGTLWPAGTEQQPVNNWANVVSLMALRNTNVVAMKSDATLTITTDCIIQLIGDGTQTIIIDADVSLVNSGHYYDITINAGHQLDAYGNLIAENIISNGDFYCLGKLQCNALINDTAAGIIAIYGDCYAANKIGIGFAGETITVEGNCHCGSLVTIAAGDISINGDCYVSSDINNVAGSTIEIDGILRCNGTITNAGTLTHGGYQVGTAGSTTANWNAAEADLVTIGADNIINQIGSLSIGIMNTTGNLTIKFYMKINGTERELKNLERMVDNVTLGPGVMVITGTLEIRAALRITVQSDAAGDDGKAITFDYVQNKVCHV